MIPDPSNIDKTVLLIAPPFKTSHNFTPITFCKKNLVCFLPQI
ncbi:hypothetical protein [Escherichia phage BI-EHEC]|nr:hypothetical protein [Escherichia phage BI-EHEC]